MIEKMLSARPYFIPNSISDFSGRFNFFLVEKLEHLVVSSLC